MMSMTIWSGFYFLEIVHPSVDVKVFARKILYCGMALAPAFWLGFALRYTGIGDWWVQRGRILLPCIPGGVAALLGLTNETHHLIWTSLTITHSNPAPLTAEYGAGFWFFVALSYIYTLAGFLVYIASFARSEKSVRIKTGIILIGAFVTVVVNFSFLFLLENELKLDPTPLSFALSAPLIAFGFFRFGVVRLFPLAASLVVDALNDAIVLVNNRDEITDLNRTAKNLFNVHALSENTGVFLLLPQLTRLQEIWDTPAASLKLELGEGKDTAIFDVRVIPIIPGGSNQLGRALVFHNITSEQNLLKAEKRRAQQLTLLEEAGSRIANSFDEKEILQNAVDAITQIFGYPETAISVLTKDNMLEIIAISGTIDFGYRPGYRQKLGEGIIGYTAALQKTYISENVSKDEYYYSTSARSGSAICTPIFKQGSIYGVLYMESFELGAFDELDVITLETLANHVSASLQRAALYAQTQTDLITLVAIQDVSKLVSSSLDLETISQTVVKSLQDTFGYTHVSIYFLIEDYLHLAAQVGYPEAMIIHRIHISQGVTGRTFRTKSAQFIENTNHENLFLKADNHITSEICVPLLKDGAVLGTLNVESTSQRQLKKADLDLLISIAGPIAIAVDNARLHSELKKMATTDAVTGLSNRHVFEQSLVAEVERAERAHTPLSLIIFDIDNFKEYNDMYGHPAGDARLRAVAEIIKHNLRKYDIAARYGGDEFAIILSDCTQENALIFAHRLSQGTQAGASQTVVAGGIPGHTLSIGIATYPLDGIDPPELLIAADQAAMRAKRQGRNRIKLASDHETT